MDGHYRSLIYMRPLAIRGMQWALLLQKAILDTPKINMMARVLFKLSLQFSEDYPNKPPTVRFVSRMFHPNNETVDCKNALHLAVVHDRFEVLQVLAGWIQRMSQRDADSIKKRVLNKVDIDYNNTPLHLAAYKNDH
ncbi:unnamed protein product [Brassica oleracea]